MNPEHGQPIQPIQQWRIENLTFAYPHCPPSIHNLSLTVQTGERIGIIGNNGAGKTTLFLLLAGILTPLSGSLFWNDTELQPGSWRPHLGVLLQNPDDQLFASSVQEDVGFGAANQGLRGQALHERVKQALELVGCQDLADRPPHHLSGGEKRLVALAGILAMQPQIILYDEPSANLDCRSRRRLIPLIQDSCPTYLVASHDLELIREVCKRVILLDHGQICADGSTDRILGDPQLLARYDLECPGSLRGMTI